MAARKPTKKVTTITEESLPDTPEQEFPPAQEPLAPIIEMSDSRDPIDEDLRKFFEQFGDDECRVKVHKFDASGRTRFITECDIESASEVFLQENWGEGKYKLTLWDGNKNYKSSKTVLIGPGKQKPLLPEVEEKEEEKPKEQDNSQLNFMAMMMENMRHNNAMMLEMVKNIGNTGKSSAAELGEILAVLKANDGGKSESISPTKLIADFMPVVKEFIGLASRGGVPERTWTDTAKEIIAEVPTAMKAMAMMRGSMPMQGNPPQPADTGSTTTLNREEEMQKLQIEGLNQSDIVKLQIALDFLKSRARNNKDHRTFVFYVLDTLDDDQSMAIAKLLDRTYEEIAILDPELLSNVYRPWFERFFGELKDALSERDTPGGEDGDNPDTQEDEGPGPRIVPQQPINQG